MYESQMQPVNRGKMITIDDQKEEKMEGKIMGNLYGYIRVSTREQNED